MANHSHNQIDIRLASLAIGATGVAFDDIGSSPLYALKAVFHGGITIDCDHVLGVLSLALDGYADNLADLISRIITIFSKNFYF